MAVMVLFMNTLDRSATAIMDGNLLKEATIMVVNGIANGSGSGIGTMLTMDRGTATLRSRGNEIATEIANVNAIASVDTTNINTINIITITTTLTDV